MRYLGIDYGSRRIGMALSDETGNFAFPHTVLPNKGIARSVEVIALLCTKELVGKIIVGRSLNYLGHPNEIMKEIQQFGEELVLKTDLPVIFEDEFLTSAEAERLQGKNDQLDASAAALILRAYLGRSPVAPKK